MELWIRSQNKEELANVKNVRFCKMKKCELKETPCTIKEFVEGADAYCVECNGEFFGEYATRERCIEIIDEIQGLLRGDLHIFLTACDVPNEVYRDLVTRKNNTILCEPNIEYFQSNVMVYQMPEE